jgi:hypothetical protein
MPETHDRNLLIQGAGARRNFQTMDSLVKALINDQAQTTEATAAALTQLPVRQDIQHVPCDITLPLWAVYNYHQQNAFFNSNNKKLLLSMIEELANVGAKFNHVDQNYVEWCYASYWQYRRTNGGKIKQDDQTLYNHSAASYATAHGLNDILAMIGYISNQSETTATPAATSSQSNALPIVLLTLGGLALAALAFTLLVVLPPSAAALGGVYYSGLAVSGLAMILSSGMMLAAALEKAFYSPKTNQDNPPSYAGTQRMFRAPANEEAAIEAAPHHGRGA